MYEDMNHQTMMRLLHLERGMADLAVRVSRLYERVNGLCDFLDIVPKENDAEGVDI